MTTCRIRVERDTPESGRFEWATLGDRGEVLASGAAELDHSPVRGACEVVLASDLVMLDRVAAPAAQQRRLASSLRFLAEDTAISEPERLHVTATSPSKDSVCLAIMDRQWLGKLLSKLESAGLVPQCIYPECLLPALEPHSWTVVWSGTDGFARTGEAEGLSLDTTDGESPPVALQLALQGARKAGTSPLGIVVRTVAGAQAPSGPRWSDALGVPVENGPPWQWAGGGNRPGLDLLHGEFAMRGTGGASLRRLRRAAMLAAALVLLGILGVATDWAVKVYERRALLAEMRGIYRETFGENAVVVDAALQMNRALADLKQQSGQIGASDFLALLGAAAERIVEPRRHRIESLSYDGQALSVTLRPQEGQQAGALLEELRAKAPPRGIDVRAESAGTTGRITLLLRATPGRGS